MKGWVPEGPADFGASSHAVSRNAVVVNNERYGFILAREDTSCWEGEDNVVAAAALLSTECRDFPSSSLVSPLYALAVPFPCHLDGNNRPRKEERH